MDERTDTGLGLRKQTCRKRGEVGLYEEYVRCSNGGIHSSYPRETSMQSAERDNALGLRPDNVSQVTVRPEDKR